MGLSVKQWSTGQVQSWLTKHGYGAYGHQFEMEGVSGDVLVHLDHETLRDLNVISVGHRLGILKAIYRLKMEHNISIEAGDFVPQGKCHYMDAWTEDYTTRSNAAAQNARIQQVMDDINHVNHEMKMLRDQLLPVLRQIAGKSEATDTVLSPPSTAPIRKDTLSPLFPLSSLPSVPATAGLPSTDGNKRNKPAALNLISSTGIKNGSRSPLPFLQKKEKGQQRSPTNDRHPTANTTPVSPFIKSDAHLIREVEPPKSPAAADLNIGAIRVYGDRLPGRENEAYKALRITLESTSQQILDMALRKYDLTDDGKNYTLVIVHGNRERYFALDDYPLKYYQQLQQAKENPMFVMRPNKQMKRSNTMKAAMPVVPSRHASLMRRADARTTIGNPTTATPPPPPPPPPSQPPPPPMRRDSRRPDDPPPMTAGMISSSMPRHGPYGHTQPPLLQHHPTGSTSSTASTSSMVVNPALSANLGILMSTSTPSTSSLQLTMNERFDEIMERWHQERNV
ncbi:hypothetical protein SYNPS1DRAFT_28815 [Syncephalis pseudoplumigaleata]|uniref:SAM domain-containing protein n=1 Tax=Syncephalis pseudoplumigaleata TaxID=1712513 RepID=A0A4P9Z156_9FUNG|nr:hypothetical protein SYNPS1DRAFT_28815 [Syncephalis pseudoplumigaleata]|eukprot:RKP25461.1 hypothetical protein SYNPS1DRAFT_28815 [Syncephalis pseudoplumigaleata]